MEYDYIVVGAGSAGCALAARLSESKDLSVLLLEAGGPDERQEIHIPILFAQLFKSDCDWAYFTEPQAHLNNRSLYWPRGKMLGGCSSINAMIYIRGDHAVYDRWGVADWSYQDLLPYFKRAENNQRGESYYHGANGPLSVSDLIDANPLSQAFVDACQAAGYPANGDFNGAQQEGCGLFQVTQGQARRCSAAAAYLRPALTRANLTVITHALATNLSFDGQRVTGVNYLTNGSIQQVRARREVILAGGAINSPQLLMLSGIGKADELRKLGIEVKADLPSVGENLQDHLTVFIAYHSQQPITLANAETEEAQLQYQEFGRGPLTSNVGEAGCFVKTRVDRDAADLQIHFAPSWFLNHGFTIVPGHGFTFGPTLVTTESRGNIKLRSNDPSTAPMIQPNYLQSEADLNVLMAGVRISRELAESAGLSSHNGGEYAPGRDCHSETQMRDYIRNHVETLYHPVGTCRMGDDEAAVVDGQLRVRGVTGLRIADASIIPIIPNGNTNAAAIMIGEKAAELIKTSN